MMPMRLIKTVGEMRQIRTELQKTVGLVPTMGKLHAGHKALLEQARNECDFVIGTIFVNKTQFDSAEDFQTYPRTLDADLELMNSVGTDYVFAPSDEEMFPSGNFNVVPNAFNEVREVRARPTHFTGVLTAVVKLFTLIKPQRAYFGQKDAQQLCIIQAMNHDLLFGIEIVAVPTVREADGLAFSSRNALLSKNQRLAATVLYKSLKTAESMWQRGTRNCNTLRRVLNDIINEEPLVQLEYTSTSNALTMSEVNVADGDVLLSVAAKLGNVRLIDNLLLVNR